MIKGCECYGTFLTPDACMVSHSFIRYGDDIIDLLYDVIGNLHIKEVVMELVIKNQKGDLIYYPHLIITLD